MILDWQRLILNLRREGMSAAAISRKVKCAPETVQHLARGDVVEPKFSIGVALLDLHLLHCRDKHNIDALSK